MKVLVNPSVSPFLFWEVKLTYKSAFLPAFFRSDSRLGDENNGDKGAGAINMLIAAVNIGRMTTFNPIWKVDFQGISYLSFYALYFFR